MTVSQGIRGQIRELRIIAWPLAPIKLIAPTKPERLEFPCIIFPRRRVCGLG